MISFTISVNHKPTQSVSWIKRRFNAMLRDLHYGIMYSMIGKNSFLAPQSAYITAELETLSIYKLHVSMRVDDPKVYDSIVQYLSKSNKIYRFSLTTTQTHAKMEVCDTHATTPTDPQPVTSATS